MEAPRSMTTSKNLPLLDPPFMRRLEQLQIVSRKIFAGKFKGERVSKRKGQSAEFADYKNYAIGDDLRFLDWSIYARLDKLFIKLFREEEDLDVTVLIDCSTSMDWGAPNKFWYARRLAAALSYIALGNFDRVNLYGLSDTIKASATALRGRSRVHRVLGFLQELTALGRSDLGEACRRFAVQHHRKGVVIILSDFYDKNGYEEPVRYLLASGADIYVLQILSPWELQPELAGDLKLIDVEDGDAAEVTITSALMASYKKTLNSFCQSLHDYCSARGITYMLTGTDVPAERLILSYLRSRGLVR
jgi:uncharacterized protein (DUF58 family)